MTGQYTFSINQGSTFDKTLTWKTGSGTIDVTGWTAAMQVRDKPGGKLLLDMSVANSRIIMGTTNGLIRLVVPASITSALDFESARYDLELTSPTGQVTRLLEGVMNLSREVTK
jgi:hypothetical protein